jgi:hypothetical protein
VSDIKLDELAVAMAAAGMPGKMRIETSMSLQSVIDIAMATRFASDDALMSDNVPEAKRFATIHQAFDKMAQDGLNVMAQQASAKGLGPRDFDDGKNPFTKPGAAIVLDKQATHAVVDEVNREPETVVPDIDKGWN